MIKSIKKRKVTERSLPATVRCFKTLLLRCFRGILWEIVVICMNHFYYFFGLNYPGKYENTFFKPLQFLQEPDCGGNFKEYG